MQKHAYKYQRQGLRTISFIILQSQLTKKVALDNILQCNPKVEKLKIKSKSTD